MRKTIMLIALSVTIMQLSSVNVYSKEKINTGENIVKLKKVTAVEIKISAAVLLFLPVIAIYFDHYR